MQNGGTSEAVLIISRLLIVAILFWLVRALRDLSRVYAKSLVLHVAERDIVVIKLACVQHGWRGERLAHQLLLNRDEGASPRDPLCIRIHMSLPRMRFHGWSMLRMLAALIEAILAVVRRIIF